jgi:hypothetical protein
MPESGQGSQFSDLLWAGRSGNRNGGGEIFHVSRPALGCIHPPVQRVLGLSRGSSSLGVVLTTHPFVAPRLKKE